MGEKLSEEAPLQVGHNTLRQCSQVVSDAQKAAWHINEHYNVAQLCLDLPKRLRQLVDGEGDRLKY